jgi:hypothetical protein
LRASVFEFGDAAFLYVAYVVVRDQENGARADSVAVCTTPSVTAVVRLDVSVRADGFGALTRMR